MTPRTCRHIKTNGIFCGSAALRGRDYCFFHLNHLGRKLRREKQSQRGEATSIELPPLESPEAIQIALMEVIDAILNQRLDSKRAGLVLYALQTASSNLRFTDFEGVCEGDTVCDEYETMEEDYEIVEYAPDLQSSEEEEQDEDEEEDEAAEFNALVRDKDRPYVGRYTEQDKAEASTIIFSHATPPDDEDDHEEVVDPYSGITDPEALKQELRVSWAYIERMEQRHWKRLHQPVEEKEVAPNLTVIGMAASPQSLLFGLKKPPVSVAVESPALHVAGQGS